MLIGESNVAIDPAIGGYGVADIYLGEFSPHSPLPGTQAGSSANLLLTRQQIIQIRDRSNRSYKLGN